MHVLFRTTGRCNVGDCSLLCVGHGIVVGRVMPVQLASDRREAFAVTVRVHKTLAANAGMQKSGDVHGLTSMRQQACQTRLVKGCEQHVGAVLRTALQK